MKSAKRSHKNLKPLSKKALRALNEDYYIQCHDTNPKSAVPANPSHSSRSDISKAKVRSLTLTTERRPDSSRPPQKIKFEDPYIKGIDRTRSRTLVKSNRQKKRIEKSHITEQFGVALERVASTLAEYREKLLALTHENKKLVEENRRLRANSTKH